MKRESLTDRPSVDMITAKARFREVISRQLAEVSDRGLTRETKVFPPVEYNGDSVDHLVNFSSNDYLNLAKDEELRKAVVEAVGIYGVGASASRLVCGHSLEHELFEVEYAKFLGVESAAHFGAGYLANLALMNALALPGTVVIADRLIHASLIDGIRSSQVRFMRYQHRDLEHVERLLKRTRSESGSQAIVLVTESVFSMDGTVAPIGELARLAELYEAMLVVDEAHALGVFGPQGRGVVAQVGCVDQVMAISATCSKALGCYGGLVGCDRVLSEYLINKSRPLIYNTGLPPLVVRAARKALEIIQESGSMGEELLSRAGYFAELLKKTGFDVVAAESQIVPLLVGDSSLAVELANRLRNRGVFATAFRAPTVPEKTARIRFSITLAHSRTVLEQAVDVIKEEGRKLALI